MNKLLIIILSFFLLCCNSAAPSLPLGTKIKLNDQKECWIVSKRFDIDGNGCYDVRYPIDGRYETITVWEFEFYVEP